MTPEPLSPYAVHKLASEQLAGIFTKIFGLETVALRYFNVFGPRQDPTSEYAAVIPLFLTALLEGRRPVVFGDGEQTRDFVYIENIAQANLLAAEAINCWRLLAGCLVSRSMRTIASRVQEMCAIVWQILAVRAN